MLFFNDAELVYIFGLFYSHRTKKSLIKLVSQYWSQTQPNPGGIYQALHFQSVLAMKT